MSYQAILLVRYMKNQGRRISPWRTRILLNYDPVSWCEIGFVFIACLYWPL